MEFAHPLSHSVDDYELALSVSLSLGAERAATGLRSKLHYRSLNPVERTMRYLHTMIRASDLDANLTFFCDHLGLVEVKRYDSEKGRFTLVFLAAPADASGATESQSPLLEITHNWDFEAYDGGRNFGHLAYRVDNIYTVCQRLMDGGVTINRPPRDGYMAFVRSPEGISIELLQEGEPLAPQAPWASMDNTGSW